MRLRLNASILADTRNSRCVKDTHVAPLQPAQVASLVDLAASGLLQLVGQRLLGRCRPSHQGLLGLEARTILETTHSAAAASAWPPGWPEALDRP